MKIYLDEDGASPFLARLLRQAGHDAQLPADVGLKGKDDAVQLTHAVHTDRVCLTKNYCDFENLHNLIMAVQGHYPGILVVRQDNDPNRDLKPHGIVRAVGNLLASGLPIADSYHILNQWR
jgi:predicted nuclease of predicted toxin-antitoxin system